MVDNPNQVYIGDGVYVTFSGYDLTLSTDDQFIYLDKESLEKLMRFAKEKGMLKGRENG